jgi:hypothetical protein
MLGDSFRDKPEASARSLLAITEEDGATIGHLRCDRDVFVVHARSSQLKRRHESKIEQ